MEHKKIKMSALALSVLLALTACSDGDDGAQGPAGATGQAGTDGQDGVNGSDGIDGTAGKLTRLATVPTGAEVTGIFLSEEGDLFFNAQHPSDSNNIANAAGKTFHTGTVGVLAGVNFNNLPETLIDSPVPVSDAERQTVMSAYGQYQVLGQTGDTYEGKLPKGLGHIYSMVGDELILENDMPDFNGFIQTGAGKGYLFTNWEMYPGGMSRMAIEKDNFGSWKVTDAMMLDFDGVHGTAANCFGSVTPWNTPLTSEEWIVNSKVDTTTHPDWNNPAVMNTDIIGYMWQLTAPDAPNPYRYGYIAEVQNPTSNEPTVVKHYALGRYEHENATVMPDGKTVYLSQDDTGGVLFKFVADTPEDLSSGTLYGAKLTQDVGQNDPATTGFDVSWVELGHGDNAMIEAWIADFDGIGTDQFVEGETSYMTMADVEAWANGDATYPTVANGGGKVTAGEPMDDRVVFLESRQAARLKGATAEWRKLEGISINTKRAQEAVEGVNTIDGEDITEAYVYLAIADLDNTLIDNEGDIQLSSRVKDCGGVYRAKLEAGYNISRIEPLVMGSTYRSSLSGAARCDVDQLSQPDNVIVMDDGRIIIGEDGFQENNTLWLYEPVKK
ncbi:alkaline phosphatase PhoX [Pseudoalteromonas piratica]|uniref:Cell surface protein n=1 Tax=Pseudoalteromonas piratica TaxID=1348114 RepID=A0A0A7EKY8_9GAMM|nr:alkaline phosphatase PhoX [Pseudoalteromonas piratica]AIY67314.1 cell surface protein [Pseudoalteromonas piratica]